MSVQDLRNWMEQTGRTIVDIASMLKLDPGTVRNFLNGKSVHRSTRRALEELVYKHSKNSGDPEAA